jgi:hypothetical protein
VAEFVLAGQGGAFGQGVGRGAEFEGFEQPGQIGADGLGGDAGVLVMISASPGLSLW